MHTALPPQELAGTYLKQAIAEYGQSSEATRTMQRLATHSPELYCAAAVGLLSGGEDSPGHRYCAVLLSRQPGLLPLLTDSFLFTRQQALNLCRRMLRIDPAFQARLIRCLPAREGEAEEQHLPAGACERALDLLDALCPGAMLVPVVRHLANYPDPRISSKATLLIGKRIQDGHWAGQQWQRQEDPRVRANSIESIWGIDSPECRALLWSVVEDKNCRVAGNAWFGLHLLHEPGIDARIAAMAKSEKPDFRRTAAWAMGKIGGPECVAALTAMVKDQHAGVRGTALRALVTLTKQQNQ